MFLSSIWQRLSAFLHWHYRFLLRTLAAASLIVIAVVLAWQFYVLPRLDSYRPWLMQKISTATGSQISMGRLSGGWRGIHPHLRVDDLKIYSASQIGLKLASVEADLSWWSLVRGQPIFSRLAADAPGLTVHRNISGVWFVAGFQVQAGSNQNDNQFLNWLLAQGEMSIRGGQLSWLDEFSGRPLQVFSRLELTIRQNFGRHRFELSVLPPAALASPLTLSGNWRGSDVGDWRNWTGQIRAEALRVDLAQLSSRLPVEAQWFNPLAGTGAVKTSVNFEQAKINRVEGKLKIQNLNIQWPGAPQALRLPFFDGSVLWKNDQGQQLFQLKAARVATSRGDVCQDCRLDYQSDAKGSQELEIRALTLNGLGALTGWLPPAFQDANLKGTISKFSARWQGPWQTAKIYNAEIAAQNLELALPQLGLPLLGQFNLDARLDQSNGKAKIQSNDLALTFPAQFMETLHFDSAAADLSWKKAGKGWSFDFDQLDLVNDDTDLSATASYVWPGSGLGSIVLTGDIRTLQAKRAYLYLPRAAGDDTLDWLKTSLLSGKAVNGKAVLRGNLKDFPYRNPKDGLFRITADAKDVALSYADDWPGIEHIDAALDFHGAAMDIRASKGKIFGASLRDVNVSIAEMDTLSPLLKVQGKAQGATREFLKFVRQSPVRESTSGFIDDLKAEGEGELNLQLTLPLENTDASKVTGEYRFAANTLDFGGAIPVLNKADGRIAFTEHSLAIKEARAQSLGGSLKLSGSSNPQGDLLLNMAGQAEMQEVAARYQLPFKTRFHGKVPFQANLTAGESRYNLSVQSSLLGMVLDLPAPMAKASSESRPMRLRISGGTSEPTQLEWAYDNNIQTRLQLGHQIKGQVVLGAGSLLAIPKAGVSITGSMPDFNVQTWLDLSKELMNESAGARPAPLTFDVRFNRLSGWGRRLNEVRIRAQQQSDLLWKGSVESHELAGSFDWNGRDKGKLNSRLTKLWLPFQTYGNSTPASPLQHLPALDLEVNDFRYKNLALGKLDIDAVQQGENWRLNGVNITNPDGKLNMSGLWSQTPGRISGNFAIETENLGKLLTRMGVPDTMRRAPAKLSGEVAWDGELFPPDLSSMQGKLRVDVEAGQFAKIDPGVGRLLSILSLQSLARRVQLDFRDVFSEGFEFDSIRGDSVINRGIARTDNLVIAGPAAQVLFKGDANFMAATQNLRVRIVPVIGDSVAVATTLINPVIGVATFLLQRVLKDPLGQLVAYEYDITGSMLDPQIKSVSSPLSRLPFQRNK